MRQLRLACLIASVAAAGPAMAFDPGSSEIVGLRLGMHEAEATTLLAQQGYRMTRASSCWDSKMCRPIITASTKDGQLAIEVSQTAGIVKIVYALNGHGVGEADKITAAIIDRFGRPDQHQPMTWCQHQDQDGTCPADQPTLSYSPQTLTLRLQTAMDPS